MDIFNVLNLIGGLCLFLFGMSLMGQALERRAGNRLRSLLGKLTGSKGAGLLTGLGITAVIQSSSATTVMVVGFVNSGLMTLKQSINVIMGANIGTTVTAWILSLTGIDSGNLFVNLLKPSSFTPVLALIGSIFYMFSKKDRRKDTGMIMLGFALLMFGMDAMSGAVSVLKNVPEFQNLFLMFTNPILGVMAGAVLTAVIQSSSASVGILQALASTGQVTYGAAVPIIMGQNIGTCVTALLSSIGANKNAKRAALVHLSFNVIGTAVLLTLFYVFKAIFSPIFLTQSASLLGIAVTHSIFNILCTILMLPMGGLLEKLVCRLVPYDSLPEKKVELDERLLTTPSLALERCNILMAEMAGYSMESLNESIKSVSEYSVSLAESIRNCEDKTDHYEDLIGTYLVKLSARKINEEDSLTAAKYLKLIGDFERIADHSVNILESVEEMHLKGLAFSENAGKEFKILTGAVTEVMQLAYKAFKYNDLASAIDVEPLEQVVDELKERLRTRHILRMQKGNCDMTTGFVWNDMLTNLERISDHCSNIAGCVIDAAENKLNLHESVEQRRSGSGEFERTFEEYHRKYELA